MYGKPDTDKRKADMSSAYQRQYINWEPFDAGLIAVSQYGVSKPQRFLKETKEETPLVFKFCCKLFNEMFTEQAFSEREREKATILNQIQKSKLITLFEIMLKIEAWRMILVTIVINDFETRSFQRTTLLI